MPLVSTVNHIKISGYWFSALPTGFNCRYRKYEEQRICARSLDKVNNGRGCEDTDAPLTNKILPLVDGQGSQRFTYTMLNTEL